jgi:hypothetical protein
MSEKLRSTPPSEVQMENRWKKIKIEEKLDVISGLENGRGIVDVFCKTRLALVSLCRIRDNDNRIKESAKCLDNIKCQQSETETVCVARLPQSYQNEPYRLILIATILLIAGYSQCVDKA